MWYIQTVEYNSALKNKGVLTHAKTRVSTEDTVQGEIGQSQTDKYYIPDMRLCRFKADHRASQVVLVVKSLGQDGPWRRAWLFQPQDWKTSVFIPIPKKGNAKECSNYHKIEKFIKAKCPPDSGDARIP